MNLETYKKRMAEMGIERENLEERIKPFYTCHPREWKESAYLPGGEKKSLVPLPPEGAGEDLSHLNPYYFKAAQIHGRKAGRKARTK